MQILAEVLQLATEMERLGCEAYLKAAERIHSPVIKSILFELANDEDEHEAMVGRYYHALCEHQGWPAPEGEDRHIDLPDRVRKMLDLAAENIRDDSSYADIYNTAAGLERESRDFYLAQAEATDDRRVAEFFKFLARVEDAHLMALTLLLESETVASLGSGSIMHAARE